MPAQGGVRASAAAGGPPSRLRAAPGRFDRHRTTDAAAGDGDRITYSTYRDRMPLLTAADALPHRPARVLVAGTSGSGKSTVAARIAAALDVSYVELDSLYHGPGWVPRPSFVADVEAFIARPAWVTEWQYREVRARLAERADLLVWLDPPRSRVMSQMIRRTVVRRIRRQHLWNGNYEPPLRTIFTDPEHMIRWAWTSHRKTGPRVLAAIEERPDLPVVRLRTRADIDSWLAGPLRRASTKA